MSDVYGKDILFHQGDFELSAGGDYLTVEGEANLREAIYRRLLTKPGTFRLRPDYGAGVGTYVKKLSSATRFDELKHRVKEQVMKDPRIDEIVTLTVEKDADVDGMVRLYLKVRSLGREIKFEPMLFTGLS